MIHLITFADERMTIAQKKCYESFIKYNWPCEFWPFNKSNISEEFYKNNKTILDNERGAGFWLWKPYFINDMMNAKIVNEGDILIYCDAGIEWLASAQYIIDKIDEDIFFFTNGWPHVEWCKADVYKTILPNYDIYRSCKQVQASVIFFKVNQKTKDFVKEWLMFCQMPGFIDDSPSKLLNYPTFAEHRHDQAILTCCALKNGYTIDHWWPTQYSNHLPRSERDNYPVMFNHHRKRNSEW